jgi:hypothetical protein
MALLMAQDALDQAARMPEPAPFPTDLAAQISQMAQDRLDQVDLQSLSRIDWADAQERAEKAMEKSAEALAKVNTKLADMQFNFNAPKVPMAMQLDRVFAGSKASEDGMYQSGLNLIDAHQYDQALSEFNNVVSRAGARAEGALYWKAYVLNKLGRAADAQAAIDTLRKTYPSSRWLDDAKALELEVKQSKGPVSPDSETDEDIKILALNGLMQSDPEKALPQVENMLKGSHSPRLKRQALIVIAQNNTARAQQDLEQIARGGNPDLQVRAILYLGQKRNANNSTILLEIYTASSDAAVKRAVLNTFMAAKDREHLLQIVRAEKDDKLRASAIAALGGVEGQPELWQLYQGENGAEGKVAILNAMMRNGNADKLAEVARTDKDPKVRQAAIRAIASQQAGTPSATLTALYTGEQDEKVKRTIIDGLSNPRNCKSLVDVAKAEKEMKLKLDIVGRLSNMTKSCPAATEYLTELLNR